MGKIAAIVDCVSANCYTPLTETLEKLIRVDHGGIVEVICNTRYEASQVKAGCERARQKVLSITQDAMGLSRVLIQKTH
jgi:TusA-related sulfurtransferase